MNKSETLEDFYKVRLAGNPPVSGKEIGHFNVFRFEELTQNCVVEYSRRDFFKIGFIQGRNKVYFADKSVSINKQAILFGSPHIFYSWEKLGDDQSGYSCIFTADFFHHFGNPADYAVFQPGGMPVLELTDDQAIKMKQVYEEMLSEWNSDYVHKHDRMRVLVFELLHSAMKMYPAPQPHAAPANAAQKITAGFLELLEAQFTADHIILRSPSDFAERLSVHVNHLNKALQETMQKSTYAIIQERILLESRILLKHSNKDISEIAFALGFKENSHFNSFFRKYQHITPSQFRAT
jgi:AraC-like DNA-binding protein